MDNAFLEAGEPALNNDDAEAEFDEEMQDLDQMVESFKICAKEQWGDPTHTDNSNWKKKKEWKQYTYPI